MANLRDDFGFMPNTDLTGSAGAAALKRFSTWAQAESAAGKAVVLDVPAGTYYFNHQHCYGWMLGIRKLHVRGLGRPVFQNTYDPKVSGANFAFELPWGIGASADELNKPGARLMAGSAGQSSAGHPGFVALAEPADYGRFAVGDWVLFGQGDIQSGVGIPPNMDYFQFAKILAIHPPGILHLDVPIERDLLTDLPEVSFWGKARIWNLKSTAGKTWDIEHLFEDLQINPTVHQTFEYFTVMGRRTTFRRCTVPGVSQTVSSKVVLEDVVMTTTGEPDKLVDEVVYDRVRGRGLDFQSSSIKRAVVRDSRFEGFLLGNAQDLLVENTTLGTLAQGELYGLGRRHILRKVTAPETTGNFGGLPVPGNVYNLLNGMASYANGRFTIGRRNPALYPYWNAVTGMGGYFAMPEGYPTDPYHFTIFRQTADAVNIYWDTDCRLPSAPAGSTGIYLQRAADLIVEDCGGCDALRMASEAHAKGFRSWERSLARVEPGPQQTSASLNIPAQAGLLTRMIVDVQSPDPTPEATAGLDFVQYHTRLFDMTAPATLTVHINTKAPGRREYTLDGITGLKALDTVRLGDRSIGQLPADRWCNNAWAWAATNQPGAASPPSRGLLLEVVFEYATGRGRRARMGANNMFEIPVR